MKKIIVFLLLVISFRSFSQVDTLAITKRIDGVDLFVVGGQSNGVGQGDSTLSPTAPLRMGFYYWNNSLNQVKDPVANANYGSAWPSFVITYYGLTGRRVCIVQCSKSGASMSKGSNPDANTWDTTGALYPSMLARVDSAISFLKANGYNPTIKGLLWVQGEADAIDINNSVTTVDNYKSAFRKMIKNFRNYYNDSIPIYVFRTGTSTLNPDAGFATIRQAEEDNVDSMNNVFMAYRGTLDFQANNLMQGNVHYTQAGYNLMGVKGAETVVNHNTNLVLKSQIGKVGFGTAFPTAEVELGAGTTTIPPIRFGRNGSLLTTPLSISLEVTNTALYFTDSISGTNTRRQIPTVSNNNIFTGTNTFNSIAFNANNTYDIGAIGATAANVITATLKSGTSQNLTIRTQGSGQAILFQNGTVEAARITATNGNLLIGSTTDNGYKLDVTGTINSSSTITANSFVKSGGTSTQILMADGSTTSSTNVVYTNQANTYTAGSKQTLQSSTTTAGLNLVGISSDPSSLSNGDIWHNNTSNTIKARLNGTTRILANTDEVQTFSNKTIDGSSNTLSNIPNTALSNYTISINGISTALGSSIDTRPIVKYLNADVSTTSTTMALASSDLTINVAANKKYHFHAELWTGSSTANGIKIGVSITGTGAAIKSGSITGQTTGVTNTRKVRTDALTGASLGTFNTNASTTSSSVTIDIYFTTTNTGTITIWTGAATAGDTESLIAGSTTELEETQ